MMAMSFEADYVPDRKEIVQINTIYKIINSRWNVQFTIES
jgi:hypothetical protein